MSATGRENLREHLPRLDAYHECAKASLPRLAAARRTARPNEALDVAASAR